MSTNGKLKFAGLCRVSTEGQEKKGESLATQRQQITQAVSQLGGEVVRWYSGQEHGTAGYERKEFDRLLADAQKRQKSFDALMVTDADRWSRDNERSKQGLKIFKDNNIRFFIGSMEHDLFNPAAILYLGMSAEIGGFIAMQMKRKSMENRIKRAKRGCPSRGNMPFGRTFNRETETWGVIEEKKQLIQECAERYLLGESIERLALEKGMKPNQLHKIITRQSGTELVQTFTAKDLNINETTTCQIPRLLTDEIIKACLDRAKANRTYHHGQLKNRYLLSRMIFCEDCGYSFFGATNTVNSKWRYYRHIPMSRVKDSCNAPRTKGRNAKPQIKAEELENIVLRHLFETFGNPVAIEKAIQAAIPNMFQIKIDEKRLQQLDKELGKVKRSRDTILNLITDEQLNQEQASKKLSELKLREKVLSEEIDRLLDNRDTRPDPTKIKNIAKKVSIRFKRHRQTNAKLVARKRDIMHDYESMTWEEKRTLVESVFNGKTESGKRMGVFIKFNKDAKNYSFTIRGHLIEASGLLPLSDSMQEAYFSDCGGNVKLSKLTNVGSQQVRHAER